jgi:hypothetical protein
MMKSVGCAMFAVLISSSAVPAAVEQCRFIQARAEREACYDRQAQQLAARRKPDLPVDASTKSLDDIEVENQRLKQSLRSICRGC